MRCVALVCHSESTGSRIADVLPKLLASQPVRDVSVEDVPLEEIVAGLFRGAAKRQAGTDPEQEVGAV